MMVAEAGVDNGGIPSANRGFAKRCDFGCRRPGAKVRALSSELLPNQPLRISTIVTHDGERIRADRPNRFDGS